MEPKGCSTRMLAFSCPNAIWLGITSKYEDHVTVYMPNWDPLELRLATDALHLKLDEQELAKRISLFGGTARYTLTSDADFIRTGKKALSTALVQIETVEHVRRCFEGTMDLDQVVHRLLHYCVDENDWMETKLKPASKIVASMLHERLSKKLDTERQMLMRWLDGAGKASTFAAWLFENYAHETFLKGGSFPMKSLTEKSEASVALEIDATPGHYKRFKLEATLDEVLLDTYKMPEASNLQSVDSYMLAESGLCMFQMTTSFDHEEDLEGILKLLKFLSVFDKVKADPSFAKLIFVVPSKMKDKFKKQKISKDPIFDNKSHEQVMDSDCIEMKGIGRDKKRKLSDRGIRSVKDVLDAYEAGNDKTPSRSIKSVVKAFKEKLSALRDADCVGNIPQFVIGLDYSPKR
mmetsp:Transcript_2727/g.7610  ORF Transcript_2727/g.7610 Transcript_2727/m.7610 type:complete len:407 (+) Transcript_2727:430-1650(+)